MIAAREFKKHLSDIKLDDSLNFSFPINYASLPPIYKKLNLIFIKFQFMVLLVKFRNFA